MLTISLPFERSSSLWDWPVEQQAWTGDEIVTDGSESLTKRSLGCCSSAFSPSLTAFEGVCHDGAFFALLTPEDSSVMPDTSQSERNYRSFCDSFFIHHGIGLPAQNKGDFYWMANALSQLGIKNSVVQYSEYNSMIDFCIILKDGMKLTVGRFFEEEIDDKVTFSLYNKRKLLLAGEMPLDKLIARINSASITK